ncbi:MAG: hypothetical protein JKY36_04285 [Erythrobacter sp.]|nr:hypothetical protein [Erythrobacter sp.]
MFRKWKPTSIEKILNPAHGGLHDLSDHDLAEYMAGWKAGTKNWLLAEAEMKRRQAWSGPVKLSLGISVLALILSGLALFIR